MNKQRFSELTKKNGALFANTINLGFIQASNILIQIILFPLIIRMIGISSFGYVAVANAFAGLFSLFINYGTNLSGIKGIALAKGDNSELSKLFFGIYYTRITLFTLAGIVPLVLYLANYQQLPYLLFSTPIILAELINPLFYFNGIEKLSLFNTANLLAKLSSAAFIIFLIPIHKDPWWVNFYLGIGNLFFYSILAIYAVKQYQLKRHPYFIKNIVQIIKENFFLVSNNLVVHLQQSFFLFLLPTVASPLVVGAYSLADKIISSFRMLIVAFSSALYPRAAITFESDKAHWFKYKKQINWLLFIAFTIAAAILFWGNKFIVQLFTGSTNQMALIYIQSIAFVPLLSAMNSLNIIELLIKNQYRFIFYSSITLLMIILIISPLMAYKVHANFYGFYPLILEALAIPITLYFIQKGSKSTLFVK